MKALDRSADGKAAEVATGKIIDHRNNHLDQVFSFIFVTGDALSAVTVHENLIHYILEQPVHTWPNVVFALDQYLATYCCDDGICPNPMHACGVALQRANSNFEILMKFYLFVAGAIEVTSVANFPYFSYLHKPNDWKATVCFSTIDDPPPFLSTLANH